MLQPLAPCATALEGALLGSFKVNWVGGRTVISAVVALGLLRLGRNSGWGLLGAPAARTDHVAPPSCSLSAWTADNKIARLAAGAAFGLLKLAEFALICSAEVYLHAQCACLAFAAWLCETRP